MRKAAVVVVLALLAAGFSTAAGAAGAPVGTEKPIGVARINSDLAQQLAEAAPTDELIVFVHAGGSAAASSAAAKSAGLSPVDTWDSVGVTAAKGSPAEILAVSRIPGVTYLEPDRDLTYSLDTAHIPTRAEQARTPDGLVLDSSGLPYDGSGVSIAVIDTGVDGTHDMFKKPDGTSKVERNTRQICPALCSAWSQLADTDTAGGHGTHVAGIAGGFERTTTDGRTVRGVAPDATLIGVAGGAVLSLFQANAALDWVTDNHANPCKALAKVCAPIKVVNNSWGPGGEGTPDYDPASTTSLLVKELISQGITVVFAAGNEGGDGSQNRVSPHAADPTPGVIGVANYDDADDGRRDGNLDSSSSRGLLTNHKTYPDISAPGTTITSACKYTLPVCRSHGDLADADYAQISGTSMAAPYVAGVVALLLEADPTLSPAEIEDIIEDNAFQFGDSSTYVADDPARNSDHTTSFDKGHGMVDVVAALAEVLGVTPPPPPTTTPPTSQTLPYVVGTDVGGFCGIGVVCFGVTGPKPGAHITIQDDSAVWPVGAAYSFRDAADDELAGGLLCPETHQPVPAGTTRLLVFPSGALGPVNCFLADGTVSPGIATTGTVTVSWVA